MAPATLEHAELTENIIGAALQVHRALGPGFIESFYENALVMALQKRGIKVDRQNELLVRYEGIVVGTHRLDILVNETILLELKAIKSLEEIHFAIARSYLRAAGLHHALLLNFGQSPLQIKRVIYDP